MPTMQSESKNKEACQHLHGVSLKHSWKSGGQSDVQGVFVADDGVYRRATLPSAGL